MTYLPENIDKNCGIYRIINTRNKKIYIGSTTKANVRKKWHFTALKRGNHHCSYLQNAYNKEEDKSVFEFQMFIYCKKEKLIDLEQKCIDFIKPDYNVSKRADRPSWTPEALEKIKKWRQNLSEEERKIISKNKRKGQLLRWENATKEDRESFSKIMTKVAKEMPEAKKKIKSKKCSENINEYWKNISDEQKETFCFSMSISQINRWENATEEDRAKHGKLISSGHAKRSKEQKKISSEIGLSKKTKETLSRVGRTAVLSKTKEQRVASVVKSWETRRKNKELALKKSALHNSDWPSE